MPFLEIFPPDYRSQEVAAIRAAIQTGECVAIVGLGGSGKSSLLKFLSLLDIDPIQFILIDCNRLAAADPESLWRLIRHSLDDFKPVFNEWTALVSTLEFRLKASGGALCFLFDRFDALLLQPRSPIPFGLRALHDKFTPHLSYIISTRRPLPFENELAELFYSYTIWLGPLSESNTRAAINDFMQRKSLFWPEETITAITSLSRGYPSLLNAICEAHADGANLTTQALLLHSTIQQRVQEFWSDSPTPQDIRQTNLENHPLFSADAVPGADSFSLTEQEHRLFAYLTAHPDQLCKKEDLIHAVWTDSPDPITTTNDEDLANLIRRLRIKIEADPSKPRLIQTAAEGYLFTPES